MDPKQTERFLRALSALCEEYGVYIGGCGCECGSPVVTLVEDDGPVVMWDLFAGPGGAFGDPPERGQVAMVTQTGGTYFLPDGGSELVH